MKKALLFIALLVLSPVAMACDKLTFILAQKNEDLSQYKEILTQVYVQQTKPGFEDYTRNAIEHVYPILIGWIGQKGKRFIKVLHGQKAVGYMTLEALDEDETKVAFHQAPLLPEYAQCYEQFFDCVKKEFPHAKTVYTACSARVHLHEAIKKLGFQEDDSYKVNPEISQYLSELITYSKQLV